VTHKIAVIAGDGIGKEVMPEGVRVLDAAARKFAIRLAFDHFDWSCDNYDQHGWWMPPDWREKIGTHDCIYFGATGWPAKVPDHVSLWDSLMKFRKGFDQYVNLRPVRLMPGIPCPLAGRKVGDIDYYVVRENTEGEYSAVGGRLFEGTERDGIAITMPYWDERFKDMAAHYPHVATDQYHIDGLTIQLVLNPQRFDVIVASNLFGDIISDIGPATAGTIGIAPSANINPDGDYPSLFEPVHGSAPDIYGKKIANPVGQIWSGAMLLEHLGYAEAARAIMRAIEQCLTDGPRTPDIGGSAHTEDMGKAIAGAV
jgi:tartrate dehydrogenase/decarboxylase/D-malate dehydrogenase